MVKTKTRNNPGSNFGSSFATSTFPTWQNVTGYVISVKKGITVEKVVLSLSSHKNKNKKKCGQNHGESRYLFLYIWIET